MMLRKLVCTLPFVFVAALTPALAQDDAAAPAAAQPQEKPLIGKLEQNKYVSPTGAFRMDLPVLPELGGTVTDTENVVTFQDAINTHVSVACFPMDATLRWEDETRGRKDFLTYFFANFVLPDFQQRFPGTKVESARFRPSLMDGSLLCYTLLPGGSMFEDQVILAEGETAPNAKRGNLVFVKNEHVFIISVELVDRVLRRNTWDKKPEEENQILANRLTEVLGKITFTPPVKK